MAIFTPARIKRAETLGARQAFIGSPTDEALGLFVRELQVSADTEVISDLRELWFNYHLTRAFVDSQRWQDATDAVYDALVVAVNLGRQDWEVLLVEMQGEINKARPRIK